MCANHSYGGRAYACIRSFQAKTKARFISSTKCIGSRTLMPRASHSSEPLMEEQAQKG
ncbi:hypothetical protein PILCRDRAFT_816195 [Piloderma croceum F 1598]|uniref:Uncharacterized protein n=1 Tax=Piloderma croceum (strain F 1598) TaxID=765440 RepID=A0A0C3BIV8_PILCF|nr:hypothetical protein PILCRDRAFT_816195 [Piloderma croceum F 1598]